MLGLYVHIPFCAKRCPYCDFAIHVGAQNELVSDYCNMLRRELESTLDGQGAPLTSIFFGGGTPTALSAAQLAELMQVIRDNAPLAEGIEISIEANPDGLDFEKLKALRAAGWNRLSMGVQSFDDAALKYLGRTHCAADIATTMAAARAAGFDNVSLDLIFAVPGQSRESWRDTVQQAIELEPEHVSCYSLTIEDGTAFGRRRERGRLIPIVDDEQAALMADAVELLGAAGLGRYEISNYARAGRECRHNLNYWRGGNYLACGNGAHGHADGVRWWNERSTPAYVESMRLRGTARVGQETLEPRQRLDEIVMLGLRLREGFGLDAASRQCEIDARAVLATELRQLEALGLLQERDGVVQLMPEAMPVADAVAARLLH